MKKWSAKLNGDEKIVSITIDGETRRWKVFSKRSGQCLELLVKQLKTGITSVDMKNKYGIDDNKLFDELKNASGFKAFMVKQPKRRENKDVWKLNLESLWSVSNKITEDPIWWGKQAQGDLQKFHDKILKNQGGFFCNISGVPLLADSKGMYVSNLRQPAIDHRRPRHKGGEDKLENFQFLSHYMNEMKNQQCAKCSDGNNCKKCALAFPEKFSIVYPTDEDISYLTKCRPKK
jgi:hypothetical protein